MHRQPAHQFGNLALGIFHLVLQRLAEANRALEVLLDRAATLDDVRLVFRNNDGRVTKRW